jgi:hypothetical protein
MPEPPEWALTNHNRPSGQGVFAGHGERTIGALCARNRGQTMELAENPLSDANDYDQLIQSVWIEYSNGNAQSAKAALKAAIAAARTFEQLHHAFPFVPSVAEDWERIRLWLELEARLNSASIGQPDVDDPGRSVLAMRLKIALRDYDGFQRLLHQAAGQDGIWMGRLRRLSKSLQNRREPDFSAQKVFGIGLSKSGTTSLMVHHEHSLAVYYRSQPVSHGDHRSPAAYSLQGFVKCHLGSRIKTGGGLVQEKDPRVPNKRSRNSQPLFLPAREQ